MKSANVIVASIAVLASRSTGSIISSSASSSSAMTLSSVSQSKTPSSRDIHQRLRNINNHYKSAPRKSTSRHRQRRHLQLFQIVGPVPAPTATITTTTTSPTSSLTTAIEPSGIFGTSNGETPSTTESPSVTYDSSISTTTTTVMSTTSLSFSMLFYDDINDLPYLEYECMSMIDISVSLDDTSTFSSWFSPSLAPSAAPTVRVTATTSAVEVESGLGIIGISLSMDYEMDTLESFSYDFEDESITTLSMPLMSMSIFIPPVSVPIVSEVPTMEVQEETKCEFCSDDTSMDESIIIPFSDETTCGMAKEIVVQLNSTSEDCELARQAEEICCPKLRETLIPSITSTVMTTPAPTISWKPTTGAPIFPPASEMNKSTLSHVDIIGATATFIVGMVSLFIHGALHIN